MNRTSNDSHADARRSTKLPIHGTQTPESPVREPSNSEGNKSKKDPVSTDEKLPRNVNGGR